jgi:hypothetical protein
MVERKQQRRVIDERTALARTLGERQARISFEVDHDQASARAQDLPYVEITVDALQSCSSEAIELRESRVDRRRELAEAGIRHRSRRRMMLCADVLGVGEPRAESGSKPTVQGGGRTPELADVVVRVVARREPRDQPLPSERFSGDVLLDKGNRRVVVLENPCELRHTGEPGEGSEKLRFGMGSSFEPTEELEHQTVVE